MATLMQFFKDDAGEFSCMRLMCALVTLAVLGVWIWGNLSSGEYVPLGYAEAGLLSAAHGCKAMQGHFEYGTPAWGRGGIDGGMGA